MAETHRIELPGMPSALAGYLKAARSRARGLKAGATIPRIEAAVTDVLPQAAKVARYRELCGFEQSKFLPASYPHVLAAPLHLALLTHPAFPFRLIGAVHVRNEVTQHRGIRQD